jgi:cob(I)alamin adenosyltransferase
MKIYTKTGDKGKTSLIGGKRVDKFDLKIESYGTVDELISYVGLIRDLQTEEEYKNDLVFVQDILMRCASHLAADESVESNQLPIIEDEHIKRLELSIDKMDQEIEPLTSFILPGGHPTVSHCHIARTICRRAERRVLELSSKEDIFENVIKFLNRLSDYLYTLSRSLSKNLKAEEICWKI